MKDLAPSYDVEALREDVDELPLALVAPLRAEHPRHLAQRLQPAPRGRRRRLLRCGGHHGSRPQRPAQARREPREDAAAAASGGGAEDGGGGGVQRQRSERHGVGAGGGRRGKGRRRRLSGWPVGLLYRVGLLEGASGRWHALSKSFWNLIRSIIGIAQIDRVKMPPIPPVLFI